MDILIVLFNCYASNTKTNSLTITLIVIQKTIPAPQNMKGKLTELTSARSLDHRAPPPPRSPPSPPPGCTTDLQCKMCAVIRARCYYHASQMNGRIYGQSAERKKSCCQCAVALTEQIHCWDFFPVNPKC